MKNVYVPAYQAVKTAHVLANSALEGRDYVDAQIKLAEVANDAYELIRTAAMSLPLDPMLTAKEAMATRVAALALNLYETHTDLGSKIATHPDYLAEILEKLATAVIVDEVLSEQLPMLEGETKLAAQQCQYLGREFAMSLVGEILK